MQIVHQRCAGLDVHQQTVVADARWLVGASVHHQSAQFETTSSGLLQLSDWLERHQCTHVAMEATGVYWRPLWHVLEGHFELVLANAAHVRNVPGRKSDLNDARWLADLLAHGLIRPSFVPPTPIQDLRDLTRTRKQLVRETAQHTLRIQKVLEDANIKITGIISEVLGVSGRAILNAIINGESDPERLLACTTGRLTAPRAQLVEALRGLTTNHHRFLLRLHLGQIDALQRAIAEVEGQIGRLIEPFRQRVELLSTMPGISDTVAHMLVAEIGTDMSRFPSSGHLISWAGLCPRMDESAGKRRSTRIRHGAPWLKTTLVTAAWAAVGAKDTYLRAQFHRLKTRRGPKKAIIAVAASMLTAAYHMLLNQVPYQDLGGNYFDQRDRSGVVRRLKRRIESLGYKVVIQSAA
jgi:transposase